MVDVIPSDDGAEQAVPGGGPMNAAIAAARLGVPTAFVGRVSTDPSGDLIWAHLNDSNVILDAAQRGPEPTARAVVVTKPVQSFRFEGENTADASMTDVDISSLGPGPHILHAGTLGIFRGTTAAVLAGMLDGFNGVLSFDPNIRPQVFPNRDDWLDVAKPWLDRATVVKASDEDLDWIGTTPSELLERSASVVLRTTGGSGVEVFLADGTQLHVAAEQVDVVDTVGAGDSFCGAVLVQLYRRGCFTPDQVAALGDADWRSIVEYGVRAAAITVSRLGADPPHAAELDG